MVLSYSIWFIYYGIASWKNDGIGDAVIILLVQITIFLIYLFLVHAALLNKLLDTRMPHWINDLSIIPYKIYSDRIISLKHEKQTILRQLGLSWKFVGNFWKEFCWISSWKRRIDFLLVNFTWVYVWEKFC